MKKLLRFFLCVMFLVWLSASVTAKLTGDKEPNQYPFISGISHVSFYGLHSVPEPATLLLLGSGLIGLGVFGRKKIMK